MSLGAAFVAREMTSPCWFHLSTQVYFSCFLQTVTGCQQICDEAESYYLESIMSIIQLDYMDNVAFSMPDSPPV